MKTSVRIALFFLGIFTLFFSCFFGIVYLIAMVADTSYVWRFVLSVIAGVVSVIGLNRLEDE